MLQSLVSLANLAGSSVYYLLSYSIKTGQFLVTTIHCVLFYLSQIIRSLFGAFSVLSESVGVFLQDIVHYIQQIFHFVLGTCDGLLNGFNVIYCKLTSSLLLGINVLISVSNFLVQGLLNIYNLVIQACVLIKLVIVLFGSGIWFLITLPPILLYYAYVLGASFIQNFAIEVSDICYRWFIGIKSIIYNIIVFVIDVPLESLAGLAVALSFGYIFAQFYAIIGLYVKQQLRKVIVWAGRQYSKLQRILRSAQVLIQRRWTQPYHVQVQRQSAISHTEARPLYRTLKMVGGDSSLNHSDTYCIICQERNKCVLLLPCKHLCLCLECSNELGYYNYLCPICRTNIERTMKIYV
ncbi:hypothetical protein GWI33_013882 [Rhynchophorus ferrugineus]|uniref:RING-type domain-containing protein n=1 Tax=Rhynchophorus ferrugineus TaxID=354439 RepID=A0A834M7F3_RHYFE|nr:hypothetical protein GWI33_013882 [Rhynchophorus ferrugineus]